MRSALIAESEASRHQAPAVDQHPSPSPTQLNWLRRGLSQPGGKLPLFDNWGQRVNEQTVRSCIAHGWAEPWFANPLKPDWLVCKLTSAGRSIAAEN
jgi:hypothetical protein